MGKCKKTNGFKGFWVFFLILFLMTVIPAMVKADSSLSISVVTSDMKAIAGTASAESKVSLYSGTNIEAKPIITVTAAENNTFSIKRTLKTGEVYTVVSTSINEETGEEIAEKKVVTVSNPDKKKISAVTDKSSYVIGVLQPNTKVKINYNKKNYYVTTDDTGVYKHTFSKKFTGGETITVYQQKSSAYVKVGSVTAKDTIAPKVTTVSKVYTNTTKITGKTEAKAKVKMYVNNKYYKTVTANASGNFTIYSKLYKKNTALTFTATDASKNTSKKYSSKVIEKVKPIKKILNVPFVKQLPELPRGCEVTSLAMVIQHSGKKANKMTLAKQVKKDKTPYKVVNGKVYTGNPNVGFVGDMYSFKTHGYGVYNGPIEDLAEKYLPGRIENLTGQSFNTILDYVAAGKPVWIVTNSWFTELPSSQFKTWYTPQGPIKITMRMHSVVVTGYDSKYVYINDPLHSSKNRKLLKSSFIKAYNQMGKQAVTYL